MTTKNQYFPQTVSHPGTTLQEKLEEMEMSQKDFSVCIGKSEEVIINTIKAKNPITTEMAVLFESVLQIPAHFWINRQKTYDECIGRNKK